MTAPARRSSLLLTACAAHLVIFGVGVYLLARDRSDEIEAREANLLAIANLDASLTDAERAILFAVIQGVRLHPDVPASFRACLDRARLECRAARANAAVPNEAEELERLAAQLEEVGRRGEEVLVAPAGERLGRYDAPGTGFQATVTKAWQHLSAVRALNMVGLERAHATRWDGERRVAVAVSGLGGLSLLLTAFVTWRLRAGYRAEPGAAPDTAI